MQSNSLLFNLLVEKFGAHSTWEGKTVPKLNSTEYEGFLKAFAKVVGAANAGAVKLQISAAVGGLLSNVALCLLVLRLWMLASYPTTSFATSIFRNSPIGHG